MPLETEIKMRVPGHSELRTRLRDLGAEFIRREIETNTFLDTPEGKLLSQGSGLRVRKAEDLSSGASRHVITHKGPKLAGPMKIREETELAAESHEAAVKLLTALGYQIKLEFEKKRETWELDGCEVVLDELPGTLGKFVEIEGPSAEEVTAVREKLGLTSATAEPDGYAVLVAKYLGTAGGRRLTFAD